MSPEPILKPMLASPVDAPLDAPLDDPRFAYEPKYDGIRAIAEIHASGVRLFSRLGNEKTAQFPEIAAAFRTWAARLGHPVVLDGEIVALDAAGRPAGFQHLQGRIHLTGPARLARRSADRAAFIAFDLLRDGPQDLRNLPWLERRAALERLFGRTGSPLLRISVAVRGDGRALYQRARDEGWEGLIAKRTDSTYRSGKRSPDWRKLKIVHEQEFVIGGWTEPRETRAHFGALLLGVHGKGQRAQGKGQRAQGKGQRAEGGEERAKGKGRRARDQRLVYAGHVGTGFDARELARVMALLKPLETPACPFDPRPHTNEKAHFVRPALVAQIKFTEWTADGKLRHPVYLGLRDDKKPAGVTREAGPDPRQAVCDQLRELEQARRDGTIRLPGGHSLKVTNLHKVFWPARKLTKGDLLRYYAQVSPYILPAIADRPLVMKRFPNGIAGQPFYQHRAVDAPPGVRVEPAPVGKASADAVPQLIGGDLTTLLYMAQLAAISQDPWFSRVSSPEYADYVALDLDPPEGTAFGRVLDVARWIRDELDAIGAQGVPKTSGADGLHIYIPLPAGTPYEAGRLFCQIVGTIVSEKHPKAATLERSVRARGARVYVDCLQNIPGKTLATAYSARASAWAGVSAPLTWREVDRGVRREDFTIETMAERIRQVGDPWAALRESNGVDLSRAIRGAAVRDTPARVTGRTRKRR